MTRIRNNISMGHYCLNTQYRNASFLFQQTALPSLDPETGLWNCSVPHWPLFQTHLACNLWVQCQGEEDEDGCHYTRCDSSGFFVDDKCYILSRERILAISEATTTCASIGGRLANLKTEADIKKVATIMWKKSVFPFFIGLQTDIPGLPSM